MLQMPATCSGKWLFDLGKCYACLNITNNLYSPLVQLGEKKEKKKAQKKGKKVDGGEEGMQFACNALALDVCRINGINIRALNVRVYIYKIEDLNLVTGDCS